MNTNELLDKLRTDAAGLSDGSRHKERLLRCIAELEQLDASAPDLGSEISDHCRVVGCLHKQYSSPVFPADSNPFVQMVDAAKRIENLSAWMNRRVEVEQVLLDVARGKRPPPDAAECRKLAMRLGDPTSKPVRSVREWWFEIDYDDDDVTRVANGCLGKTAPSIDSPAAIRGNVIHVVEVSKP